MGQLFFTVIDPHKAKIDVPQRFYQKWKKEFSQHKFGWIRAVNKGKVMVIYHRDNSDMVLTNGICVGKVFGIVEPINVALHYLIEDNTFWIRRLPNNLNVSDNVASDNIIDGSAERGVASGCCAVSEVALSPNNVVGSIQRSPTKESLNEKKNLEPEIIIIDDDEDGALPQNKKRAKLANNNASLKLDFEGVMSGNGFSQGKTKTPNKPSESISQNKNVAKLPNKSLPLKLPSQLGTTGNGFRHRKTKTANKQNESVSQNNKGALRVNKNVPLNLPSGISTCVNKLSQVKTKTSNKQTMNLKRNLYPDIIVIEDDDDDLPLRNSKQLKLAKKDPPLKVTFGTTYHCGNKLNERKTRVGKKKIVKSNESGCRVKLGKSAKKRSKSNKIFVRRNPDGSYVWEKIVNESNTSTAKGQVMHFPRFVVRVALGETQRENSVGN